MKKIIKKESIEAVKAGVDIVAHIETTSSLRQLGDVYVGSSPLVADDPGESLRVDPVKRRFSCKASGKKGDVIDYEMALGRTGFIETVEFLATLNGIELDYEEGRSPANRQRRRFAPNAAA